MKLKENITGKKACYKTTLRKFETSKFITFKFIAHNTTFNSFSDVYNSNLYEADVCEVFIKNGTPNHYYEIEVAPNGAVFLADIENVNGNFKGSLISENFLKTSVKQGKNKYKVTIKIPREKICTKKVEFNAFRIETDGVKPEAHLFALNPTLCGSFHKIECLK